MTTKGGIREAMEEDDCSCSDRQIDVDQKIIITKRS